MSRRSRTKLEHWTPTPEIEDAIAAGAGVVIRKHRYHGSGGRFGPGTSGTDEIYALIHGEDELLMDGAWCHAVARSMAFFRRDEVYGIRHGSDGSGTHQILTILFRAPKNWQCGIPRTPMRLPPVWWRTLMSLEEHCDFDVHGQRVLALPRIIEFLENFSVAGLTGRGAGVRSRPVSPRRPDTEADWMETWAAAEDIIRQRASAGLTADELADAVHVSPAKLRRVFHVARGVSPKIALTAWRIEQSQKLLMYQNMAVTEVAARVGYTTVQRFCAAFKQISGVTPTEYGRKFSAR